MSSSSFPISGISSMTSTWENEVDPNSSTGERRFKESPSIVEVKVSVDYAIPSGASITRSQIWATINTGSTGAAIMTVNDNIFYDKYGSEVGANVILNANAGTLELTFTFKANGDKKASVGEHSSTAILSNVYLWVEYWIWGSTALAKPVDTTGQTFVPPQSVAIFDSSTWGVYIFDGVTNIQHNATLKTEEDPDDKKKEDYVNNAKNEPDKVVIDVVMSDVYADPEWSWTTWISGSMVMSAEQNEAWGMTTRTPWTRSANAYRNLHYLKTARKPLCVVTPQFVYTHMLLTGVSINQEENNPNGWSGQLTFETIINKVKRASGVIKAQNTSAWVPSASWLAQHGISL